MHNVYIIGNGTSTTQSSLLTVTKLGKGSGNVSSTPAGISCGAVCSDSLARGSQVILTAQPDAGSILTGWSGACAGRDLTCSLTMDSDASVTAEFNPLNITPILYWLLSD
jgi:hypothetical protein